MGMILRQLLNMSWILVPSDQVLARHYFLEQLNKPEYIWGIRAVCVMTAVVFFFLYKRLKGNMAVAETIVSGEMMTIDNSSEDVDDVPVIEISFTPEPASVPEIESLLGNVPAPTPVPFPETGATTEPVLEPEPEIAAMTEPVLEPEPEIAAMTEPVLEPEPEIAAMTEPVLEPEPEIAVTTEPVLEPEPEIAVITEPVLEPEPEIAAMTEPVLESEPEIAYESKIVPIYGKVSASKTALASVLEFVPAPKSVLEQEDIPEPKSVLEQEDIPELKFVSERGSISKHAPRKEAGIKPVVKQAALPKVPELNADSNSLLWAVVGVSVSVSVSVSLGSLALLSAYRKKRRVA